ncbi:DUF697 domain-containing protein [Halodesulfovibrio marinisediminis]|uniref:DUF697 domain-containing protein n=1 Tax=Halodesulfovibrio marinisediminis DSM 17456 TaxID=1121457 RepID=A0A1N6DG62_9BACT|nr:DUF697 domain-containing protein [Halodesulfovibrio marinisediminis]SIN69809.1 protein of unknown function [Halodesulfovibrio marinisediminis DSM 17456]
MQSKIKVILITLGGVISIALGSLLLSGIRTIAEVFAYIDPTYVPIVFWALTVLGCGVLGYAGLTLFFFPKPLLIPQDPTEEQIQEYRKAYVARLQCNPFIKTQQLPCKSEQEIIDGIVALETEANRLIEETSKRVFIGTATAQNGRLDTLIVFALITHLIYKITKLYAQRPHVSDLITLYKNVVATAFFAGAMEDIVVEEYTQQIVGPLVATSVMGSVPGAQAIASVITASLLDGSMNALLTMRCGIIARDYMSIYTDDDLLSKKELRKSATREAAGMFMRTSGDTIATVAQLLISGASKTVKRSMAKAWDAVRGITPSSKPCPADGTDEYLENTATSANERKNILNSARECVSGTAEKVASGVSNTGKNLTQASKKTASGVASGVTNVASTASKGVSTAATNAAKGVSKAAGCAGKGISATATSVSENISNVASVASSATSAATKGVSNAAASTANGLHSVSKKTAKGAAKANSAVKRGVKHSGKKISSAAGKTKNILTKPFSKKKTKKDESSSS